MALRPRFDQFFGPAPAPSIEQNPIDGTVDLVWTAPGAPYRLVVSLASRAELQALVRNAIEAAQHERRAEPTSQVS
jgi:hypothetical protein